MQTDLSIFIINGPNLNLLGKREPQIYGYLSFEDHLIQLRAHFPQLNINYYQSNSEGALIDKLQEVGYTVNGIVFNPAGYTHTSIALADTVKAIAAPVVEVHISNIYDREPFRHHSYIKSVAVHSIVGQGLKGYEMAIDFLLEQQITHRY